VGIDLPSRSSPHHFTAAPNPLYVANENDNLVIVVDIDAGKVLAEIPVGVEPEGMRISPMARCW
jgi:YVTN family beta-propeller protein